MLSFNIQKGKELVEAAQYGEDDRINAILDEYGEQILNENKSRALILAAYDGRHSCMLTLLDRVGSQILNEKKTEALKWAAQRGHHDCALTLLTRVGEEILGDLPSIFNVASPNVIKVFKDFFLKKLKQQSYAMKMLDFQLPEMLVLIVDGYDCFWSVIEEILTPDEIQQAKSAGVKHAAEEIAQDNAVKEALAKKELIEEPKKKELAKKEHSSDGPKKPISVIRAPLLFAQKVQRQKKKRKTELELLKASGGAPPSKKVRQSKLRVNDVTGSKRRTFRGKATG